MSYLNTLLWQTEEVKRNEKSAAQWAPDAPGKHTYVSVEQNTKGSPGQVQRSKQIGKGATVSVRSKVNADVLNTREPWSDKSTLNLSFVPARTEIPLVVGEPTVAEDAVAAVVRTYRIKILRVELIVGRITLSHSLPATLKYTYPQQKIWTQAIGKGKTEFSTQVLSGSIPHFLMIMLQTEDASNGTLKTLVYIKNEATSLK